MWEAKCYKLSERLRSLSSSNTFLSNIMMAAMNVSFSSAVLKNRVELLVRVWTESNVGFSEG